MSKDIYINNYANEGKGGEQKEIADVEKKIYEFLPAPLIPKSLSCDSAK